MKINRTLLSIAIAYNIINFLFWQHILTMPDATSMIYVIIFPVFWIITIIIVAILAFKNKAIWFKKNYKLSTIIGLFFCTPMLFWLVRVINTPESYRASSSYASKMGYTIKREKWIYNNGAQVIKYWKADESNCNDCDSTHFKKDSTWIYLGKKKDTIKIEVYKEGKLIIKR